MTNPTILLFGGTGQIGKATLKAMPRAWTVLSPDREDCDISDYKSLLTYMEQQSGPIDLIVNAAAYTDVGAAETYPDEARKINTEGLGYIARQAKLLDIPVIHLSTDYVFDGAKPFGQGYTENDHASPINAYGSSKRDGEIILQRALEKHIIVRTSWVFSEDRHNFLKTIMNVIRDKNRIDIVSDQMGCPTPASTVAQALVKIAAEITGNNGFNDWGIYNVVGEGPAVSWYNFALAISEVAKEMELCPPSAKVHPITSAKFTSFVRRPANSELDMRKFEERFGAIDRDWKKAIRATLSALYPSV